MALCVRTAAIADAANAMKTRKPSASNVREIKPLTTTIRNGGMPADRSA